MFFCLLLAAQENRENGKRYSFNYGLKGGFSATMYQIVDFKINNFDMTRTMEETSRVGSFVTLFSRFNIDRHFIQSEFTYNVGKYTITFDRNVWNSESEEPILASYSMKTYAFEIPLYYGYNFVKSGPYRMNFFLGPKAKILLTNFCKQDYSNFVQENINETLRPVNFSFVVGLGVNISNVFFDFAYEFGLHNISDHFSTNNVEDKIEFKRRKNILSFSLGFML